MRPKSLTQLAFAALGLAVALATTGALTDSINALCAALSAGACSVWLALLRLSTD